MDEAFITCANYSTMSILSTTLLHSSAIIDQGSSSIAFLRCRKILKKNIYEYLSSRLEFEGNIFMY